MDMNFLSSQNYKSSRMLAVAFMLTAQSTLSVGAQKDPVDHFSVSQATLENGIEVDEITINGPRVPPPGYEFERRSVSLPESDKAAGINILTVPAFDWVFGCSAVSGAMIAGYYDRSGWSNIYTGPTNGGIMPLDNSSWPRWSDGESSYPNCPLIASKNGVDGRTSRGSIDDYWVRYGSTASDPYLTNGWNEHAWGSAIGDYMMTSQSAFNNSDGSTTFWSYTSAPEKLTCDTMVQYDLTDGTLGRKRFYEARGYTVTDCYNQKTDNRISGGFSFAQFKAEIDAGRPVLLNLEGHSIVGVGYDDLTQLIYIHDTWDYNTHTMTWGSSYSGMLLNSVSIVNLKAAPASTLKQLVGAGDLNGDGYADLAGLNSAGSIYYSSNRTSWTRISGTLTQLVKVGDLNGDGRADLAGLNSAGSIYYSTNRTNWTSIAGTLTQLVGVGDLNNDGYDDLAGLNSAGAIYYSTNRTNWTRIPGTLKQLVGAGDLNKDGYDDLAGLSSTGQIYYSTNRSNWTGIPGALKQLVGAGDLNKDGYDDLAGINSTGAIYYSTNRTSWTRIAGTLTQLVGAGDLNNDGYDDLAGLNSTGQIYYSTNRSNWTGIPGALKQLVGAGDLNDDGYPDLAGINSTGAIYYSTNLATWNRIIGP